MFCLQADVYWHDKESKSEEMQAAKKEQTAIDANEDKQIFEELKSITFDDEFIKEIESKKTTQTVTHRELQKESKYHTMKHFLDDDARCTLTHDECELASNAKDEIMRLASMEKYTESEIIDKMTGFDIKRYDPIISEIIGKNADKKYDSERCLDLCKSNALLFTNAKEMCNIIRFTSF